jgi:acetyl-CoA carboxylase carboxyltransferase component/biotin carboxyl carrier protein
MVKALAGGGGRGMRPVHDAAELEQAFARCESEARAAFGNGALYAEQLIAHARHIEVQVVGDGGDVSHLWERECTLQRRNQKLVEIAPSPSLGDAMRARIVEAALRLARAVDYVSLGTFEFLVDDAAGAFFFIEANPRLQVEHTVTEAVTGIDLVRSQIAIAGGAPLHDLGLDQASIPAPSGFAIQARVNMEVLDASGGVHPSGGTLLAFEPPSGPGVRVDTFGYSGYHTNPRFDSLLAKVIVHDRGPRFADAAAKAARALREFRIEGPATNIPLLHALLTEPDVTANRVHTRFVEERLADLLDTAANAHKPLFPSIAEAQSDTPAAPNRSAIGPAGTVAIPSPMNGTVVSVDVAEGDTVLRGKPVAILEAMKMEHVVTAQVSGVVRQVAAAQGEVLPEGFPVLFVEEQAIDDAQADEAEELDLDHIRPDLAEVIERHRITLDAARPDAVARRRNRHQRTARENIDDLCDPDSFIEYGALILAAQRRRRSQDELLKMSPADGMVSGIGTVNGDLFGADKARCMVIAYDFTVFAGTQGYMNHKKKDRMFSLAYQWKLPLVLYAEGGGGRPGESDALMSAAWLDTPSFIHFARLSGLVPVVGVVSGRCFAGNAALLGCCDVIIATENANIGMGGPAMIEGGGLGVFTPEEVGPIDVQAPNGVVDVRVADEEAATRVAKQYLSYFQGPVAEWTCADQRLLRRAIPENRLRAYDVRNVIHLLADAGSVLELRAEFGIGIITALIRIEGRPMGLIANNPFHLGGAIDAPAGDKAARFMQLCDAFDLPVLSLCDTPGFMVGPEVEKQAQVRHVSRMFVTAANMDVPMFAVVLRKGYGLGAQGMLAGGTLAPFFTVAWPTGEFGPMGLEGAVRLGYRRELEAEPDDEAREALFRKLVDKMYEEGKGINVAAFHEIDDVIDPADTRRWLMRGLRSLPPPTPHEGKRRQFVDTW